VNTQADIDVAIENGKRLAEQYAPKWPPADKQEEEEKEEPRVLAHGGLLGTGLGGSDHMVPASAYDKNTMGTPGDQMLSYANAVGHGIMEFPGTHAIVNAAREAGNYINPDQAEATNKRFEQAENDRDKAAREHSILNFVGEQLPYLALSGPAGEIGELARGAVLGERGLVGATEAANVATTEVLPKLSVEAAMRGITKGVAEPLVEQAIAPGIGKAATADFLRSMSGDAGYAEIKNASSAIKDAVAAVLEDVGNGGIRDAETIGRVTQIAKDAGEAAAPSLSRRVLASVVDNAVQGAVYSSPDVAKDLFEGNPSLAAERLAWSMGLNAAIGGGSELIERSLKGAQGSLARAVDRAEVARKTVPAEAYDESRFAARSALNDVDEHIKNDAGAGPFATINGDASDPGLRNTIESSLLKNEDKNPVNGDLAGVFGNKPKIVEERQATDELIQKLVNGKKQELTAVDLHDLEGKLLAQSKERNISDDVRDFREQLHNDVKDYVKQRVNDRVLPPEIRARVDQNLDMQDKFEHAYVQGKPELANERPQEAVHRWPDADPRVHDPSTEGVSPQTPLGSPSGLHSAFQVANAAKNAGSKFATPIVAFATGHAGIGSLLALPAAISALKDMALSRGIASRTLGRLANAGSEAFGALAHSNVKDAWQARMLQAAKGSGIAVASRDISNRLTQGDYEDRRQSLQFAMTNPRAAEHAKAMANVFGATPNVAKAYEAHTANVVRYLNSQLPKPPSPPNPFNDRQSQWKPTLQQLNSYAAKEEIVKDPMKALDHLKNGTLSMDHVMALRAVWPQTYQRQCMQILQSAPKNLTTQQKSQLSVFLGEPIESYQAKLQTMMPASQQQAQSGGSTPAPKQAKKASKQLSKNEMNSNQRALAGSTN